MDNSVTLSTDSNSKYQLCRYFAKNYLASMPKIHSLTRQLIPFAPTRPALRTLHLRTTSNHSEPADGIAYRGLAAIILLSMAARKSHVFPSRKNGH